MSRKRNALRFFRVAEREGRSTIEQTPFVRSLNYERRYDQLQKDENLWYVALSYGIFYEMSNTAFAMHDDLRVVEADIVHMTGALPS